ncbi:MAG TPA: response regulator transcription factor [Solirubrobacteraceae bacterium]|jgi:two-component system response regulator NreC|nr:response regulator transcription factor [Solirubrobacteraceae bacterium]
MRAEDGNAPIRVAFADGWQLFRGDLRSVLEEQPDIELLPGADDVASLAQEVQAQDPGVLVLDLGKPRREAIEALAALRRRVPNTRIVVLSSEREAASAGAVLDAGASAFVARESVERDLPAAVRSAALGERYLSPRVERELRAGRRTRGSDGLTPRELEVLRLIAHGHTSVEIADELRLSPRTVETHRARIHKKLGLDSRAELVRYSLARGLLRP